MPNNQEVSLHVKAIDNNGNEFQIPFNELSVMKGSAFKNIDELYLISKSEDSKKTYSLYENDLGKDEYETRQIPNENNQSVDSRINLDNINGRQYIDRFFELQSNLYQKQNMYKHLEIEKLKKDDSVSEMYITQKSKELEKESVINNRKINSAKSFIKTENPTFDPFLEDNINNVKIVEELNQDLTKSNQKDFSNNMDYKKESLNNNNEQHFIKNNGNVIQEKEELQKLKSVEVEKNVIGLLPKEQQENTFKETLSRLDNNKTSLKDNLKNYISNEKIDNVINSVKQHFENIKVKAEDVQQTFKDLGSWNTENKFIKNIDNVVDKVKGIAQNNEDKLDINDPDLLKKLETKFKESNDFIENIEKTNNIDDQLSNERLKFHENTLKIINPEMESTTNTITSSLSDLSKEDKLNLYNYSKDINSLNQEKNFNKPENIKTAIESQKLINSIENELGKSTVDESRKEYLVSDTIKPSVNNNFNNNPNLKKFTNNANQFINKIDKNDLKSYQQNSNIEISKINNNQKSNTLKNNDLLKRYNKQNEPKRQDSKTQEEEQTNEKSIKKGRTHSM